MICTQHINDEYQTDSYFGVGFRTGTATRAANHQTDVTENRQVSCTNSGDRAVLSTACSSGLCGTLSAVAGRLV